MNEQLYIGMARAQETAGDVQAALTILTSAIKQYPESADLYLERGRIYNSLGNKEAALFDLRKAAEIKPEIINSLNFKSENQ